MRKNSKDKIYRILLEMECDVNSILNQCGEDRDNSFNDCIDKLDEVTRILGTQTNSTQEKYNKLLQKIINDFTELKQQIMNNIHSDQIQTEVLIDMIELREKIDKEPKKIEVLFLPYKSSMWTSLESIWKAAVDDLECDACVMPIPYYELDNNGNKIRSCYEGNDYPDYVPVVEYQEFDIELEKPDIIFIHNPYDEGNNLTNIEEKYYCRNIYKHTSMLVYSPYHTIQTYNPENGLMFCFSSGLKYVDRIILQSEQLKRVYEYHGYNSQKLLPLGSPKMDAIQSALAEEIEVPEQWRKKILGKKVFLLNTTLTFIAKYGKEAIDLIVEVFQAVTIKNDHILIWRPHPLEEAFVKKNLAEFYPSYIKLVNIIASLPNSIVDKNGDYKYAFKISDAMYTTYSSLITEYMLSGKPVYTIEKKVDNILIDYGSNYYIDELSIQEFIDMVVNDTDSNQEARKSAVDKGVANSMQGNCGQKVYDVIKSEFKLKGR